MRAALTRLGVERVGGSFTNELQEKNIFCARRTRERSISSTRFKRRQLLNMELAPLVMAVVGICTRRMENRGATSMDVLLNIEEVLIIEESFSPSHVKGGTISKLKFVPKIP
jgi:hypothetical protein